MELLATKMLRFSEATSRTSEAVIAVTSWEFWVVHQQNGVFRGKLFVLRAVG